MSNIKYDEINKLYMVDNNKIYEIELSINENNKLRKLADITTLGNYDMNLLYRYAILKFNNKDSYDKFLNEPIRNIFVTIPSNNLSINNLMVLAYNYVVDKKDEAFTVDNNVGMDMNVDMNVDMNMNIKVNINYLILFVILILFLLNIYLIYYLCSEI
jgi:hypothetical protein